METGPAKKARQEKLRLDPQASFWQIVGGKDSQIQETQWAKSTREATKQTNESFKSSKRKTHKK